MGCSSVSVGYALSGLIRCAYQGVGTSLGPSDHTKLSRQSMPGLKASWGTLRESEQQVRAVHRSTSGQLVQGVVALQQHAYRRAAVLLSGDLARKSHALPC